MNISVKLFATLRKGRFDTENLEVKDNSSIKMICHEIGIKDDEKLIILVNGRHAVMDQILSNEDTLAIFPVIGGG